MSSLKHSFASLSGIRKIILIGSILALLSVFMPWHTIGSATIGNEKSFTGFEDQNFIIGLITFILMLGTFLLIILPLLGIRLPRWPWRNSSLFLFFGGETFLLVFVLTVMHATSLTRAVNYDLRLGIYFGLIGAALVFLGGYTLKAEESQTGSGHHELFVRPPRERSHRTQLDREQDIPDQNDKQSREDSRMKLDI